MSATQSVQYLVSLPARMAADFEVLEQKRRPTWFATSDPAGSKVGSGGGTAHLLAEAWRHTAPELSFSEWLNSSRKLMLHGGGQSRRLPAYAPVGKLLMPMPVFRWSTGQRLDQTLLDLQLPDYERALQHAPPGIVAMVTSGDVLLRFGPLPAFPSADVIGLGMWVSPEKARNHGVFFAPRHKPTELAFCLQKPAPERLRELAPQLTPLIDTGMWLLSEKAVQVLMERCGWSETAHRFKRGHAAPYDLYTDFGAALGTDPRVKDPQVNSLTSAVVPLPDAEFYHFGATWQMVESLSALQTAELDERKLGLVGAKRRPDQHVLNSRFNYPLRLAENYSLWVENSTIPESWSLAQNHAITGVPSNDWKLKLEPGTCVDFAPMGEHEFCVRTYGFDDIFSGTLADQATRWLGRPARDWFAARGLDDVLHSLQHEDIQRAPLFPVCKQAELNAEFIEWLSQSTPAARPDFAAHYRAARRLSAEEISATVNLTRLYQQRRDLQRDAVTRLRENFRWSIMFKLDLAATAQLAGSIDLPLIDLRDTDDPMHAVHDEMFRAAVRRAQGSEQWRSHEQNAFAKLRDTIVHEAQLAPALPRCDVLEDQIVWARSPVRLDLAGGWSDTPPYCIENGGRVLNMAVNLNGQPPIQVFARVSHRLELVVRSIDLGVEQRLTTYEELDTYAEPGSEFSLAKAALALAGFLPRFHSEGGADTLRAQLESFGGGIELSMLSAVPKGSGLGTSSVLAATLLAALSDLCGLKWEKGVLFTRALALEQLLTTGGGWQDQAGAIYRGIKLIETQPGLQQRPAIRWLPEHLFGHAFANRTILLYYTGLTRLAKNILHEIVRGMFLNSPTHLRTVAQIAANADRGFAAIQECDYEALVQTIRRSWELNQQLDSGTNPREVQQILDACGNDLASAKLLGAGGGGFLLMFARTESAASRIRQRLTESPPNPRARFVEFSVSDTGLQLTRS